MKNMGIEWRVILPVGIVLCLGISAITITIASSFSRAMTASVRQTMQETAEHYANAVKAEMVSSLGGVRAMATVYKKAAGTFRADRAYYIDLMAQVVQENHELFGIWACFEANTFDGKDAEYVNLAGPGSPDGAKDKLPLAHDHTGRFIPFNYIPESGRVVTALLADYNTPGDGDYYLEAKKRRHETISTAYFFQEGGHSYYVASVAVPIIKDGQVIGVSGGDLNMTPLNKTLKNISLYESGYVMLLDDKGFFAYAPDEADWGQDAKGKLSAAAYGDAMEVSRTGRSKMVEAVVAATKQRVICALAPIAIGGTGQTWVMRAVIPYDEAMAPVRRGLILTIVTGASVLLISLVLLYWQVAAVARILRLFSSRLFEASSSLNQAAASISEASNSLAEGATEQAASLEETSAALEEISSMTRQNAENSAKTNEATQQTASQVNNCNGDMTRMNKAMDDISDKSEKIGRIIKTIEDITFQTNLLALNAAVEAARAGEAGKGFAVVADEVRNLSLRSALAAKETTELIGGTVSSVRHGSEIVGRLAESFQGIEVDINNSARLILEISSASNEQAQGLGQLNIAVTQMDKVTQETAANASKTASITTDLNLRAQEMEDMVEELAQLVSGRRPDSAARPSSAATRSQPIRLLPH